MDTCGQGIPRSVSAVSAESYGVLSANSFSLAPHSGSRARGSAGASSGGASIRRLESILQSELESLRQSCPQEKSSILSVSSYISSQDSLAEAPTPIRLDVASASEKPENVGLSSDVPSKGNMSLVPDRNSFRSGDVANLCSKQMMALLVEHPAFVCFFMTLTTYALFASDLNQKYGSKDTEQSVHIVNTVVFLQQVRARPQFHPCLCCQDLWSFWRTGKMAAAAKHIMNRKASLLIPVVKLKKTLPQKHLLSPVPRRRRRRR